MPIISDYRHYYILKSMGNHKSIKLFKVLMSGVVDQRFAGSPFTTPHGTPLNLNANMISSCYQLTTSLIFDFYTSKLSE